MVPKGRFSHLKPLYCPKVKVNVLKSKISGRKVNTLNKESKEMYLSWWFPMQFEAPTHCQYLGSYKLRCPSWFYNWRKK